MEERTPLGYCERIIRLDSAAAATPFTQTEILGSTHSLGASSPQALLGTTYDFASWSDGGAASHNVVANAAQTWTATYVPGSGPPPAPWVTSDVGSTGAAGSAIVSGSTFTLKGAGADIWNTSDAFRFVDQPMSGDGQITARVTAVQNTNAWAKAGVMIRETLNGNARNVLMAVTPGNGLTFQRRTSTGGDSSRIAGPHATAPYWVRLTRSGTTLRGFVSTNGTSWTQVGSVSISMASSVRAGLAVC